MSLQGEAQKRPAGELRPPQGVAQKQPAEELRPLQEEAQMSLQGEAQKQPAEELRPPQGVAQKQPAEELRPPREEAQMTLQGEHSEAWEPPEPVEAREWALLPWELGPPGPGLVPLRELEAHHREALECETPYRSGAR